MSWNKGLDCLQGAPSYATLDCCSLWNGVLPQFGQTLSVDAVVWGRLQSAVESANITGRFAGMLRERDSNPRPPA
jgi:hypothetical protein